MNMHGITWGHRIGSNSLFSAAPVEHSLYVIYALCDRSIRAGDVHALHVFTQTGIGNPLKVHTASQKNSNHLAKVDDPTHTYKTVKGRSHSVEEVLYPHVLKRDDTARGCVQAMPPAACAPPVQRDVDTQGRRADATCAESSGTTSRLE